MCILPCGPFDPGEWLLSIVHPSAIGMSPVWLCSEEKKDGNPELITCRRQKEQRLVLVKAAQEAISRGMSVPSFDYFFLQIATLQHSLGTQRLPINQALQFALERYGLTMQLMEGNGPRQRDWERRLFDNLKTAILGKSKQSLIAPLKKG